MGKNNKITEKFVEPVLEDDDDDLINFSDEDSKSDEDKISEQSVCEEKEADKGKYSFGYVSEDSDDDEETDDDNETDNDELNEEDNAFDEVESEEINEDDSEDPKEVRKKAREASKENQEKAKRTIFVGNLTSRVTKKVLFQLFQSNKAIGRPDSVESIRFRGSLGAKKHEKKLGIINKHFNDNDQILCAFVVLKSEDDVIKCLNMNNYLVDGRHIRVDRIKGKKMSFEPRHCVFLGNLPYSVEEEQVREEFVKCGDLVNVRLVRDRSTGNVKGFGYVEYKDKDAVKSALKLSKIIKIGGREIRVQKWTESDLQETKRKAGRGKRKAEGKTDARINKMKKVVLPTNIKNLEIKDYIKKKQEKNTKKQINKTNFVKSKRKVKVAKE